MEVRTRVPVHLAGIDNWDLQWASLSRMKVRPFHQHAAQNKYLVWVSAGHPFYVRGTSAVQDDLHAHSVNVGYFPEKVCDLLCISELKRFTSFEGLWVLFERLKILRLRWCVQTRILVFCFSFKKESVPCMQMEYAVGFNWCDASHCYNLYYRTRWDEAFEL